MHFCVKLSLCNIPAKSSLHLRIAAATAVLRQMWFLVSRCYCSYLSLYIQSVIPWLDWKPFELGTVVVLCLYSVWQVGSQHMNCFCVLHTMSVTELGKGGLIQAVTDNLQFYRWITWNELKTWADLHGVWFHPHRCRNRAAADSTMSNVATICAKWLLFYL